ncbi:MAG: pyridoxine 5'-phosphate synthase [Bacteroidia bacterium]
MGQTRLSVNINKIATLRNSRGGNNPDLILAALNAEKYGAQGITVHPRPDERHIRFADVYALKKVLTTEFNIEGNPMEKRFMDLVLEVKPHQVTLVPDSRNNLTSNQGWDTVAHSHYLREIIGAFKEAGIRTSLFIDPQLNMVHGAMEVGADRIELYTEAYASQFPQNPKVAIAPYLEAAQHAESIGLGLNAGHDLSLDNLRFFQETIPNLLEVSIGHALICDALYMGLEASVKAYLACLR